MKSFDRWGLTLVTAAMLFSVLPAGARAQSNPSGKSPMSRDYAYELQETGKPDQTAEFFLLGKDRNGKPIPRIAARKDRIDALDEAGNVTSSIAREKDQPGVVETNIMPDQWGKVIGVSIRRGLDQRAESWASYEYYILDASGRKTIELKSSGGGIPSPSGDCYVASFMEGPPGFYDANGIRNKWGKAYWERAKQAFRGPPIPEWPDLFDSGPVFFSPDGKMVGITASKGVTEWMMFFDAQGNKLFEKDDVSRVLFSNDVSLIAFSTYHHTSGVMDSRGRILWEKSIVQAPGKFSQDGKFLIFRINAGISMVEANTGDVVWQWTPMSDELIYLRAGKQPEKEGPLKDDLGLEILEVDATPNLDRIVAAGITQKYVPVWPGKPQRAIGGAKDHLLVFDRGGRLLAWKMLRPNTISSYSWLAVVPLSISDGGQTIVVGGENGLHTFSLVKRH